MATEIQRGQLNQPVSDPEKTKQEYDAEVASRQAYEERLRNTTTSTLSQSPVNLLPQSFRDRALLTSEEAPNIVRIPALEQFVDGWLALNLALEVQVASEPIEDGSVFNDHIAAMPTTFSLKAIVTNEDFVNLPGGGTFYPDSRGENTRVNVARKRIDQMCAEGFVFPVDTPWGVYPHVTIRKAQMNQIGMGLEVVLTLQAIRVLDIDAYGAGKESSQTTGRRQVRIISKEKAKELKDKAEQKELRRTVNQLVAESPGTRDGEIWDMMTLNSGSSYYFKYGGYDPSTREKLVKKYTKGDGRTISQEDLNAKIAADQRSVREERTGRQKQFAKFVNGTATNAEIRDVVGMIRSENLRRRASELIDGSRNEEGVVTVEGIAYINEDNEGMRERRDKGKSRPGEEALLERIRQKQIIIARLFLTDQGQQAKPGIEKRYTAGGRQEVVPGTGGNNQF